MLGLYTGSSVGALTLRAQNDNALSTVQYSRIRLSSTLATTYYIRVDGKDGTVGSVRLNVGYSDAVPKLVSVSPKFADATPPSPTIVTLNGADLLGSPASYTIATFNGRGANYNPPSSSTAYRVSPPPMAASGPVTLFTPSGFVQTDGIVRILPKIASFSPTAGPPGTDVEVRGTGFYSAVVPRFTVGGATAQVLSVFWDYDATAGAFKGLVATIRVPSGAPSGDIRVSTSIGSASAGTFTVTP